MISRLVLINKNLGAFFYFSCLGLISFFILASSLTLSSIMQLLTILVLLSVTSAKFILPKLKAPLKIPFVLLGLFPVILFLDLLIFSTGGLSSQFLVLTHFFTIGLAFLLSPQIAVSFIAASFLAVLINLALDQTARGFLTEAPITSTLFFVAYIALIPFSYILSRQYKIKEEWVKILEKQIATSKDQEEDLLKNIASAILFLNPEFQIIFQNKAASTLCSYGSEILGRDFFKFFSFKDQSGRTLASYSLPLAQTLSSKVPSLVENIQIQVKDKNFIRIDMKILPAIGAEGPLGLILIIEDLKKSEEAKLKKESTTLLALARFLTFLKNQEQTFNQLSPQLSKQQVNKLSEQNRELEHLASDFIYSLKLETGEVGSLASLVELGGLVQEIIYQLKPLALTRGLSLKTKANLAEIALIQPKDSLRIPVAKRMFPLVYVIGNIVWIKDSLERIFELVFLLSRKGDAIGIEVKREQELALITIYTQIKSPNPTTAPQLFEKFYGELKDTPQLSETSGLEGFIAKNLIDRMGGNISIEKAGNSPAIIFKITFGSPLAT